MQLDIPSALRREEIHKYWDTQRHEVVTQVQDRISLVLKRLQLIKEKFNQQLRKGKRPYKKEAECWAG